MCICAVREGMHLKDGNAAEGNRRMPAGEENLSGNKKRIHREFITVCPSFLLLLKPAVCRRQKAENHFSAGL